MHTILSRTIVLLTLSVAFSIALSSPPIPRALNGACKGAGGAPGVCIATAKCTSDGGKFINDACPNDPENIKCCSKPVCGTGNKGECRFTNTCSSGVTETNKCPGPDNFKCCMPKGTKPPPGGPPFPKGGCKQTAINGADKIVAQFPGKIRYIGCKRPCPDGSDHCTGMATDLMVAELKEKTDKGQPIAQWVSEHASALRLNYVMWGQRIWNPDRDEAKPWSQWRFQHPKDRGGNTANHWDHVHVSYK